MIVDPPKAVNLMQLQQELQAAGIAIPHGLGSSGDPVNEIYTYGDGGSIIDLPPEAEPVVAAHVAGLDPAVAQQLEDAAVLLNDTVVRDSQAHRDAFARLIHVQPLSIPLDQDATAADIRPL